MKKRRCYQAVRCAIERSHSEEQAASHESEHPVLTLQRQIGNSRIARLMGSAHAGPEADRQVQHQRSTTRKGLKGF
jgi:hypothetical protein